MSKINEDMKYGYEYELREYNTFKEEYYGGSDVYVLINGKRFHDIGSIQFSIREQAKPIYGHSSRVFDDVAVGARIVQGILRIPVSVRNKKFEIDQDLSEVKDLIYSHNENNTVDDIPDWVFDFVDSDGNDKNDDNIISSGDLLPAVIKDIQLALVVAGYMSSNEVNSKLDPNTKHAIRDWKIDNGLSNTTTVDRSFIRALIGDRSFKCTSNVNLKLTKDESSETVATLPKDSVLTLYEIDENLKYAKLFSSSANAEGWLNSNMLRKV